MFNAVFDENTEPEVSDELDVKLKTLYYAIDMTTHEGETLTDNVLRINSEYRAFWTACLELYTDESSKMNIDLHNWIKEIDDVDKLLKEGKTLDEVCKIYPKYAGL